MKTTAFYRLICILLAAIALLAVLPASLAAGNGRVSVDSSESGDGIVLINHVGKSPKKLKVRINYGNSAYNYDLDSSGKAEAFPFSLATGPIK